uniref:DUF4283 domain-containing protein n=1 Tax=Cannabis sativa TaxID=3483 RepID=A0A803NW52_CANSA
MVKKKRTVSKPIKRTAVVETETGDLPSIPESDDQPATEVFLDTCENLEGEPIEEGSTEIQRPTVLPASPKPVRWADDVEREDFSAQAKDVWSRFKTNQVCTPSTRLEFTEPMKIGDQSVAKLDLDEVECEASFWKNSVVCIVLRANPPFRVFEGFIKRVWGNLGIERIARMNSGFTLVSFRDEETRDLILETGVIHFDKKPVVLRPWTMDMDSARMVKSVPIWVRLNGLGLQYWGKNTLSALVSTIGKPIMVDKVTQSRTMIKYARVLVDMEISDHPPKTIAYINERKQLAEQSVEYEWLPSKCGACDLLGHTIANCNKEKGIVWKKKGIAEQRSKAPVAEKIDTMMVGSELGGESVGEGGCQAEKTHGERENKQPVSVDTRSKEVWLTPHKRGSKQVAINDEKATTSNGYEVLSEQVLLDNEQFIHSKVKIVGLIEEFYFTAVYGSNCPAERKLLFEKLAALGMLNRPWLILGDFNAMFNFQDRNGGKQILTKDIEDAQKWLSLGQVEEVSCSGAFYTWTNKHDMGTIGELVKKLLRVKHVLKKFNREERFYDEMLGVAKVPYATNVWHKLIVPKHRFIYWQVINEHLLTRDILSRFLPIASDLCVVCDMDPESHNHIFIDCIFAKKLIKRVEGWSGVLNWPSCLREFHQIKHAKTDLAAAVLNAVIAAVLYMLWKNRNDCLFNDVCYNVSSLSKEIKCIVKARVVGVHCKSQKRKDQYVMSVVNSWGDDVTPRLDRSSWNPEGGKAFVIFAATWARVLYFCVDLDRISIQLLVSSRLGYHQGMKTVTHCSFEVRTQAVTLGFTPWEELQALSLLLEDEAKMGYKYGQEQH